MSNATQIILSEGDLEHLPAAAASDWVDGLSQYEIEDQETTSSGLYWLTFQAW